MSYGCGRCGSGCSSSCGSYGGSSSGAYTLESMAGGYSGASGAYTGGETTYQAAAPAYDGNVGGADISYMVNEAIQEMGNENIVDRLASAVENKAANYSRSADAYAGMYLNKMNPKDTYSFVSDNFLAKNRPFQPLVEGFDEVREHVNRTFSLMFGHDLPEDIIIRVCSKEELKKIHKSINGNWNDNIQGFSMNRKRNGGMNEIFVKKDQFDRLMLTIGHELGHVMTRTIPNKVHEEAKAFAFSMAWMKTIKENNIANLAGSIITDQPARNGLHNVAFDFVMDLISQGRDALEVFKYIVSGVRS